MSSHTNASAKVNNSTTLKIYDVRMAMTEESNSIKEIVEGLNRPTNEKFIPTLILYDERGLQLFEQITHLREYYPASAEIDVLKHHADEIVQHIPDGSAVVELGAGSLRKTALVLRALEQRRRDIAYYALDLVEDELLKALSSLGTFKNVSLAGLLGTYDEGLNFIAKLPSNGPKMILWLGSSIGNFRREEATDFLGRFRDVAMKPGDMFLVGIDRRNEPTKVEAAYNDSERVTEAFIMNGLNHVNTIMGYAMVDPDKFEYHGRYNVVAGRHEAHYRAKCAHTLECASPLIKENVKIPIEEGEMIHIEYSFKYNTSDVATLLHGAQLSRVRAWPDSNNMYDLHCVQKTPFYFTRDPREWATVPLLAEWQELWNAWDTVATSMISDKMIFERPIEFRHVFIFYLGHIPAFLDILLARHRHEGYTPPESFAEMFERGMDPDVDDPSKCHPHSQVPMNEEDWPSLDQILIYRDKVRQRLLQLYQANDKPSRRLGRVIWMAFEHEAMHLETILYVLAQSPNTLPPSHVVPPRWQKAKHSAAPAKLITVPAQTVVLGQDDDENRDDHDSLDLPYCWDNESPLRRIESSEFRIQSRPVTNGEFLDFLKATVNKHYPVSWLAVDSAQFQFRVRTVFGPVDMSVATNWPAYLSQDQAANYAAWKKMRLPKEHELRAFFDMYASPPDLSSNIGFAHWHPIDVPLDGSVQTVGSCWEWTDSEFQEHPEFHKSKLYPGYSSDFFDGKHNVVLGGSWATHPRLMRRTFRNWYQRRYEFAFCGVRLCAQ